MTFGLLTLDAQGDIDSLSDRARADPFSVRFEEIQDVRRRGRRFALAANIGFATAGLAAIAGALIWALDRDRTSDPVIEPASGGVSIRF